MTLRIDEQFLQILSRSPLSRDLSPSAIETLYDASFRRQISRDSYFFHEGEDATICYVILEGRVRLTQVTPEGHQVIVSHLGPGDGLAIIVVLAGISYPVSAEAIEDCLALAWNEETITRLMEQHPQLAINGMHLIAQRFIGLTDRYRELATERVERRVARALVRLVRQAGRRTEEGILIDMPLSRQDLGEMTGTTLYTVSRILSDWEQRGLVTSGRERVVVRQPHQLVTIAEDLLNPPGDSLDKLP